MPISSAFFDKLQEPNDESFDFPHRSSSIWHEKMKDLAARNPDDDDNEELHLGNYDRVTLSPYSQSLLGIISDDTILDDDYGIKKNRTGRNENEDEYSSEESERERDEDGGEDTDEA